MMFAWSSWSSNSRDVVSYVAPRTSKHELGYSVQDDGDFEKSILVKILEVGDERAHYDWNTQAHSISVAFVCNKVEDMMGIVESYQKDCWSGSEYQITGQHITFEGVLELCKKKVIIDNPVVEGLLHGRGYISAVYLIISNYIVYLISISVIE